MADLLSEGLISLAEARQLVPASRGAERTNLSTVLRWVLKGIRGPDGERVKLEAVRLGGRWLTSRAALQRFMERLTPDLAAEQGPRPQSPTHRQRRSERAAKELAAAGW